MTKEIAKIGDLHQYKAEPIPEDARSRPKATLLNATPDPLGTIAALCGIYEGRVVRSLSEVTEEQRRKVMADMMSTVLNGPLEAVQFHWLIEGVDRSFTHQAVRGRNAFYAQESMRFAVPEDESWEQRTTKPPSLSNPMNRDREDQEAAWTRAIESAQEGYETLVGSGMPAEEARGLMPHAIQTRYHWVCDLRELLHVAGLRTCTQAQFHWRLVMASIAQALREHRSNSYMERSRLTVDGEPYEYPAGDDWQWGLIADMIRPVCYQTGRCGFMAKFDRSCSIRERVEANAAYNRPSSEWHQEVILGPTNERERAELPEQIRVPWFKLMPVKPAARVVQVSNGPTEVDYDYIPAIDPREWAADPSAARKLK